MKKFLLVLFLTSAILSGCKKDTGTNITLSAADLAVLNGQLKGSWVFPVKTITVVDNNGKALLGQNLPASAFQFDGISKIEVRPDPLTIDQGTYKLYSKNDGKIYIHINYSDSNGANNEDYQVVMLNSSTLTLTSSQPYVYYSNGVLLPGTAVTSTTLQKLNSADITGNLARVLVTNDSTFSVKVYVTHPGDTSKLIDSKANITTGAYNLVFAAKSGDHLYIDVLGKFLTTSINAYFNGLPIQGEIAGSGNETVTTNGWDIQFPSTPQ